MSSVIHKKVLSNGHINVLSRIKHSLSHAKASSHKQCSAISALNKHYRLSAVLNIISSDASLYQHHTLVQCKASTAASVLRSVKFPVLTSCCAVFVERPLGDIEEQ